MALNLIKKVYRVSSDFVKVTDVGTPEEDHHPLFNITIFWKFLGIPIWYHVDSDFCSLDLERAEAYCRELQEKEDSKSS